MTDILDRLRDNYRHQWTPAMLVAVCDDAVSEIERLTAEVASLKEQLAARGATTLACQAREGELREALDNLVASIIPMHKTFRHSNESTYFLAEQAQKFLSHSTGSKIMADYVSRKDARYAIKLTLLAWCDGLDNKKRPTAKELFAAWDKILPEALEAKHD